MVSWKIKKGRKLSRRMVIHGMDVSIETDKGEVRHWYDPHADKHGETKNLFPYGYLRRTTGADDEAIDCYIGHSPGNREVYVIQQMKAPDFKEYDEDKVMIGFDSAKEAKQAYLMHYDNPKFFGSMDEMDIDEFKNKFVNKAFPQQNQPMQQDQMMPMFDQFDMSIPQAVDSMLSRIGSLGDKDLVKLASKVWGDGYKYKPISNNQVRAELRGFLQDQSELFKMVSPLMVQQDPSFVPNPMPHEDDQQGIADTGVDSLMNESNLDGKLDPSEIQ